MSTTWTEDTTIQSKARVSKAVCTTGTEASSQLAATSGLLLNGLIGVDIRVESTTGSPFTAGTLDFYVLNPISGRWARLSTMQQAVGAVTGEAYEDFDVRGRDGSRLAALPTGLGQACEVYLFGTLPEGR